MNSGVKSDNMTKSIICCAPMKKEEIIKAADKQAKATNTNNVLRHMVVQNQDQCLPEGPDISRYLFTI